MGGGGVGGRVEGARGPGGGEGVCQLKGAENCLYEDTERYRGSGRGSLGGPNAEDGGQRASRRQPPKTRACQRAQKPPQLDNVSIESLLGFQKG